MDPDRDEGQPVQAFRVLNYREKFAVSPRAGRPA